MFRRLIVLVVLVVLNTQVYAKHKSEYLVIVTLDGMRWQEVFGGVDSALMNNTTFTHDREDMQKKFWDTSSSQRRKKLFPFLWNIIESKGQVYGNRYMGNFVNNANRYHFSYPGYNEIFTGYPDTLVNSNDKNYNKNENVLEFLNKQKKFSGKVAAFTTWDCFPYILNNKRSNVYVNSDVDTIKFKSAQFDLINDMQFLAPRPINVRPDFLTYFAARQYLIEYKPSILYIAFDETDDFAHAGEYDQYIKSAHAEDAMLADIWNYIQHSPKYANKTTLIVTCDHGRGDKVKATWKDHGEKLTESSEIWIAAIGPDTKATGENKDARQLFQGQLAATFSKLLGFDFAPAHPVLAPITSIYSNE